MVITKKINPVLKDRKAALLALMPAFLTAAVPLEAGLVMPVLGILTMLIFLGIVFLWHRIEEERRLLLEAAGFNPQQASPAVLLRELARHAEAAAAEPGPKQPARPALALMASEPQVQARFPAPSLLPSLRQLSGEQALWAELRIEPPQLFGHEDAPTRLRRAG